MSHFYHATILLATPVCSEQLLEYSIEYFIKI